MWFAKHSVTNSVTDSLASRLYLNNKKTLDELNDMLSLWKKDVNHLHETYATDAGYLRNKESIAKL